MCGRGTHRRQAVCKATRTRDSSGGSSLFSTRSRRTGVATTARPTRPRRLALTALLAALATTAVAAPAHANLTAVGPVDPATQVPAWFQDASGLKLGLCLGTTPPCFTTAAQFNAPDGEGFYFRAVADLTIGTSGKARLSLAQEATNPAGGRAAFMRRRVTIVGATPNTTYRVTEPFGNLTLTTDGLGNAKDTVDTGCTLGPCPSFAGALTGEIGPFLTWDPTPPAPPAGFIGDSLTPHSVTGGTNGNSFTVAGPGGSTTNLFTLGGMLAGPPVPVINSPAAVDFGSTPVGVPVEKTVTVRSFGVPGVGSDLSITSPILGGDMPSQYRVTATTCAGVFASGQSCTVTVQFVPTAAGAQPASLIVPSNAAGGNGTVALTGTGVAPAAPAPAGGAGAGGVAGAGASSRLAIRNLHLSHRMHRSRVLRNGLRLSMVLPQGTQIIKVAVFRYRHNKLVRSPVWVGFRVAPSRLGLYRLTLDSRALRRRLKVGRYQLRVTPGVSKQQLGLTTFTTLRVTRG